MSGPDGTSYFAPPVFGGAGDGPVPAARTKKTRQRPQSARPRLVGHGSTQAQTSHAQPHHAHGSTDGRRINRSQQHPPHPRRARPKSAYGRRARKQAAVRRREDGWDDRPGADRSASMQWAFGEIDLASMKVAQERTSVKKRSSYAGDNNVMRSTRDLLRSRRRGRPRTAPRKRPGSASASRPRSAGASRPRSAAGGGTSRPKSAGPTRRTAQALRVPTRMGSRTNGATNFPVDADANASAVDGAGANMFSSFSDATASGAANASRGSGWEDSLGGAAQSSYNASAHGVGESTNGGIYDDNDGSMANTTANTTTNTTNTAAGDSFFDDAHFAGDPSIPQHPRHHPDASPSSPARTERRYFHHLVECVGELWVQLQIPQRDRVFFSNAYCREPSAANIRRLDAQLGLLHRHKQATVQVLQCIDAREDSLRRLRRLFRELRQHRLDAEEARQRLQCQMKSHSKGRRREREARSAAEGKDGKENGPGNGKEGTGGGGATDLGATSASSASGKGGDKAGGVGGAGGAGAVPEIVMDERARDEWRCNVRETLLEVQTATLAVVESILHWRRELWRAHPFVWKGSNYLGRILEDGGWRDPWDAAAAERDHGEGRPLRRPVLGRPGRGGSGGGGKGKGKSGKGSLPIMCRGTMAKAIRQLDIPAAEWALVVAPALRDRVATMTVADISGVGLPGGDSRVVLAEQYVVEELERERRLEGEMERLLDRGFYIPLLRWSPGDSFGNDGTDGTDGTVKTFAERAAAALHSMGEPSVPERRADEAGEAGGAGGAEEASPVVAVGEG